MIKTIDILNEAGLKNAANIGKDINALRGAGETLFRNPVVIDGLINGFKLSTQESKVIARELLSGVKTTGQVEKMLSDEMARLVGKGENVFIQNTNKLHNETVKDLSKILASEEVYNKILLTNANQQLTTREINKIVNDIVDARVGKNITTFQNVKTTGTGSAVNPPPPPKTKPNITNFIKNIHTGRYTGIALKYILGGVAAGTALNIIQNNIVGTIGKLSDSDTRQIRKDIEKLKQFPPAVMNLVNIITEYGVDRKTNIAWVYIPKTGVEEYDNAGGVYLYSNGIIKTKNGRKTGKYTGAGGLQESLSMITILEQSNELEVPEERLNRLIKRTIYYLDFPSTNASLLEVEKILTYLLGKTYKGEAAGPVFLERYKKSGQWTSNFIPADIEKSINRIWTYQQETQATAERLLELVRRLERDTPTNNTFAFEDNITITWDDGTNSYERGANQPVDEPAADANQPTDTNQQNEPEADVQQQQPTPDVVDNSSEVKITGYTQCNGTYKIGCFNMEKIVQLNDCLGLGGGNPYFTQKTQNALDTLLQTRKAELTDADIDSICANKAYYKYADRIYIKDGSYLIKQGAEFNNEELTEIDGYFSSKNFVRIEMNGLLYGWKPAQ